MGITAGQGFLGSMEASHTAVIRVRVGDDVRAKGIDYQYDDKDFSLADAISFAVMARLRITRAFTFDRHFAQYGFVAVTPKLL